MSATIVQSGDYTLEIDTGDLDAAYASALRVLNAFQQVQQVSAGQRPSTYVPPRDELGFLAAGPVATTTITPVASIRPVGVGSLNNNPSYVRYLVEEPLYRVKSDVLEIDQGGDQSFR